MDDLTARVLARQWATEAYEEANNKEAFVERVLELAGLGVPNEQAPGIKPMNEMEVQAFRKMPIPFGVHRGEKVQDIRLSYLCHLTDPSAVMTDFFSQIKRYLRNPSVKRAIEEE